MSTDLARHYRRVIAHADRDAATGCLVSRYSVGSHGYAQAWDGVTVVLAHRLVWEHLHGPIPDGITVDHVCARRKCIEGQHLRLLPNLENARRHNGRDWERGRCAQGHDDAVYWRAKGPTRKKGYCHACRMDIQRRRRAAGKRS